MNSLYIRTIPTRIDIDVRAEKVVLSGYVYGSICGDNFEFDTDQQQHIYPVGDRLVGTIHLSNEKDMKQGFCQFFFDRKPLETKISMKTSEDDEVIE